MGLREVEVPHVLCLLNDLGCLLAGHAPLGAVALLLEGARTVHGHASTLRERVQIELEADADVRFLPNRLHTSSMRSISSVASKLAVGVAELALAPDEQRYAKASGQVGHVTTFHLEIAVGAHPDELAVVDLEVDGR